MGRENADLLDWAARERDSAVRQMALFGSQGVKALLAMPDGKTQDITEAVVKHQAENIAAYDRLISVLSR